MPSFVFRIHHDGRPPLNKIRTFEAAPFAVERARQLLDEWPSCRLVQVLHDDEEIARIARPDPGKDNPAGFHGRAAGS